LRTLPGVSGEQGAKEGVCGDAAAADDDDDDNV